MENLPNYEKDIRPWGQYERFTLNEKSTVKILTVKPNEGFSLQTHDHREEFWHIISGSGFVTIGEEKHEANPGDEFLAQIGQKHRLEGGDEGISCLEVSFGEFDENDIHRIEDKYGRT